MVAVGGVVQRARLIDDADRRFVGRDRDLRRFRRAGPYQRMQLHGAFDRGLRVELGGKRNLEEHVLHDIASRTAGWKVNGLPLNSTS